MKIFARQFYFELVKLLARKRTYFGFGAFLAVELLILLLNHVPKVRHHHMADRMAELLPFSPDYSHTGLTLAWMMITQTVLVLGSLYLALVCGDIVSKEVEDGTMRMMLSRPVSRARILILKYAACVFYTWALVIFIVASSLALGLADRGWGGLMVWAPWEHVLATFEAGRGLERIAMGTGLLGLVMLTLSSLAFMFSCFNMKPASATILTLSLYFIDTVVHNLPPFESIKTWFLTDQMGMWMHVFEPTIPWEKIGHALVYLGVFDLIFLAIGAFYFARRDFKS